MTTFREAAQIKQLHEDKYHYRVNEWATDYVNRLFAGGRLPAEIQLYVHKAAVGLARRVYHFTTLAATEKAGTKGIFVPRNARNAPLAHAMQAKHQAEFNEHSVAPEWNPGERAKKLLEDRMKRAITAIENGFTIHDGRRIAGIGNIATMQDALLEEWNHRDDDSEKDNLLRGLHEGSTPPYDFFWRVIEHHRTRDATRGHLRAFSGDVLPLPTLIIPDNTREGPILYDGKELFLGILDTQRLIEEEESSMAHCVGGYDIFSIIRRGRRAGKKRTLIISLFEKSEFTTLGKLAPSNNRWFRTEYRDIKTQRKPHVTFEYDVSTGRVRQVKLSHDTPISSPDDPLRAPVLHAIRRMQRYCEQENMPIQSFSGDLSHITKPNKLLTINGQEKDWSTVAKDDVIISGGKYHVPHDVSHEQLEILSSLSNVELDVTDLIYKRPQALNMIPRVKGSILFEEATFPQGTDWSLLEIYGDLCLKRIRSKKGLLLPRYVGGNVQLNGLTSATELRLPRIGGTLWIGARFSAQDVFG